MNAALQPYTVIGVTSGKNCSRVHLHVMAGMPEDAVNEALDELNYLGSLHGKGIAETLKAIIYHTPIELLGAVVFEGHLDNPATNPGAPLRGYERPPVLVPSCMAMRKPFTVVTVDPASGQLEFHHLAHANAQIVQCQHTLDFFLIGGVVRGHAIPMFVYQATPRAWPTSPGQRVLALANRYSLDHLQHLGYDQAAGM